jgi:hypothetical protein
MPFVPKSKLPRLPREWYQGPAAVLWTHTFEHRATGWLTEKFHAHFREVLLHICARHRLACPIYVLMPDHWHLVWLGLAKSSDQRLATAFLRQHLKPALGKARLQDRAHDHVLRRKSVSAARSCLPVNMCPRIRRGLDCARVRQTGRFSGRWSPAILTLIRVRKIIGKGSGRFMSGSWTRPKSLRSRAGLPRSPPRKAAGFHPPPCALRGADNPFA